MTRISRRSFGVSVGALAVSTFAIGKVSATFQSQPGGYPIASDVFTTLQKTVVPGPTPSVKIELYEIAKYQQYGFGNWMFGGPLKFVTRADIMPALYDGSAVTRKEKTSSARSIFRRRAQRLCLPAATTKWSSKSTSTFRSAKTWSSAAFGPRVL